MTRLATLLLIALTVTGGALARDATRVQVLLQGDDPVELEKALIAYDGVITHRLPLIGGIGGDIEAEQLDALATHPSVRKLTEDFNPSAPEQPRDCPADGDLDLSVQNNSLLWRVHNFSTSPVIVNAIELGWPDDWDEATQVQLLANDQPIGHWSKPMKQPTSLSLQPGVTALALSFSQPLPQDTHQNDLVISLSTPDCDVTLARAYLDNDKDFYYPAVVGADLLHRAGITGKGVTVAIIDSGLWDVPALLLDSQGNMRVPTHYDARHDQPDAPLTDRGGHGSHMASIIGNSTPVSRPGGAGFLGIAPDAALIPITTFAPAGDADFMDIIRAIQWVVTHREQYNIKVLNMSLSATPRFKYWDEPVNEAVLRAWQAGITVVAAMGNDGPDWGSVGSPANNPYVISVGAVTDSWTPTDRTDDYIPDFSSRGPTPAGHIKPDIVAPGGHITGLIPPDSVLATENPNYVLKSGQFVSTGSSQASAVVAGMVALLLEANPSLSNDDIKCLLKTSAEPAINRDGTLAYSPFTQGSGYANVSRALTLGSTECEQQSLDIDAAVAGKEQLVGPAEQLPDGAPTLPDLPRMLSDSPTEKGQSDSRRWGVAEHLNRLDPDREPPQAPGVPFDWAQIYEAERRRINTLSTTTEDN